MCSETKESKKTKHIQFILLPRYKMFWGHWTWQTSIRIILSSANFTTNLLLLPLNWHPPSKRPLWKPSKGIQGASPTDTYPARYDLPRHNNEAHSNGPDCSENCWRIETKLGNLKNTWVFPRCSAIFRLFFFCSRVEYAKNNLYFVAIQAHSLWETRWNWTLWNQQVSICFGGI